MYYFNNYYSPFHFFIGPIFMIVFWVFIVWLIVKLIKGNSDINLIDSDKNDNALNILKERYAKGDITREQFESMKNDIK